MKKLLSLALTATLIGSSLVAATGRDSSKKTEHRATPGGDRYVVVLSLDGFRDDYQSKAHTPNLDAMDREGVSGSFQPCFPSLTFPNHYAMATGLYPDNHGLVGNEFWDAQHGHYRIGDRQAVENPAFYLGEPVWNTAKRQGVQTASFYWVGSETAVGGSQPHRWKRFDNSVPYTDRADSVLSWLSLPEPERPHLVMWYIEEPDHTGHHYNPEHQNTAQMITQVDSVIGYFRRGLSRLPHANKVDFIVVSDHGMGRFDEERTVNLADYLPLDSFEHVATGPFTHLYPKAGYTEEAIRRLSRVKGIKVYRKDQLPARLHYGTSPRIGEIVVMAEMGVTVYFSPKGLPKRILAAGHGFDNLYPEMLSLFKAAGPHFEAGRHIVEPIPNITLYPLICELLGIKPSKHDADEALAKSLIKRQ